jgi:dTDP-4-amino-4,6-dideoxygalactose transaminase
VIKFADLHHQYLGIKSEIDAAVADVIRETAFISGPHATRFEVNFARFQQAQHCVGVANGTDAIEIVLEALDLPPGSEVIVPANSFIASSEAVTRSGHRVVFADVDSRTYTLDPGDVERRITDRTAVILAVHLYGQPCDMDALTEIAARRGIRIVEDAAQAHGAEFNGRRVGALGAAGTFSFYPGKNLGAYGDAGAIVTNNAALAKRCRMIANHGRVDKYDHQFEGRNSRLDGLQAAVLDVKLRYLDRWIDRRIAIAAEYRRALAGVADLILPAQRENVRHAWHLYAVRSAKRDALAAHLTARGIQTGVHYPIALPKLKAYAHLGQADAPLFANGLGSQLLSLPMGEHLTPADVATVAQAIADFAG